MTPKFFPNIPRPLLFAHRGASAVAPENTVEAFDLAVRMGAQVIECDVHLTADNEVVVLHDPTVDRTTDGHGPVRDMSYKQVSELDAGARFSRRPGSTPFLGRGCTVPRLQDVLQAFPEVAFNIELKQRNMVRQVLDVCDAVGPSQVLLTAFDHQVMGELEACAACALGLSAQQAWQVLRNAYLGRPMHAFAGRALQIPPRYRGLPVPTKKVLTMAKKADIAVHIWVINDVAEAIAWLARGVEGIMSDDPVTLAAEVPQFQRSKASAARQRNLP